MANVFPIEGSAWERGGRAIPAGPNRDLWAWLEEVGPDARWESEEEAGCGLEGGYAVVVALRRPGAGGKARISYFMITSDDLLGRDEESSSSEDLPEGKAALFGRVAGWLAGRLMKNWRHAWRRTFVTPAEIARQVGADVSEVRRWARDDPFFPEPVLARPPGPLYVAAEVDEWLETQRERRRSG